MATTTKIWTQEDFELLRRSIANSDTVRASLVDETLVAIWRSHEALRRKLNEARAVAMIGQHLEMSPGERRDAVIAILDAHISGVTL